MLTLDRAAQTAQSYIHRVLEEVEKRNPGEEEVPASRKRNSGITRPSFCEASRV